MSMSRGLWGALLPVLLLIHPTFAQHPDAAPAPESSSMPLVMPGYASLEGFRLTAPGGMQPFGAAMSSQDLANVLTFVRNSWGNEAPMITKEMVQKVRDEEKRASQWTAAELEPFAKKNVPGDIPAGPGATAAAAPAAK